MRKLTLDDIADARAYERGRDEFRARIIALKRQRRIGLGDFVTLVFENTDTMRFQVQEMARAEKMLTDEAIQHELDTYNAIIPQPGELSATLLVELTDKQALQEWLPRLVGIEHSVAVDLDGDRVAGVPDQEQEGRLTREAVTASVHFVKFPFSTEQVERFADGPAALVADHEHYQARTELTDDQRTELLSDLRR